MKLMSTVEYDSETDELMLPIPDEILDSLGWDIGDVLQWEYNDDSIVLKKVE
jgi:bifunctional DNA-binding transcriptional regulator/antitoxin component of YhaV-PrlF toxin-antitoxin module